MDYKKRVEKTYLQLNCYARGTPAPSIALLKDGLPVDIDPTKFDDNTFIQQQIDSPDANDVGIYTCKAENQFGVDVKYQTVTAEGNNISRSACM